jgi:hypothetical protein
MANNMQERVRSGTAPLGYQPPDREHEGCSLAPKGFAEAVLKYAKEHPLREYDESLTDYTLRWLQGRI